jgi:hypothetical protein
MKDKREKHRTSEDGYQWEGIMKGGMRVNMVDVFCIHV